jgi:short subunit dehydrogenase-like uncharacterized protein
MSILVYGAYGYTGRLIVEEALGRGFEPVIAGRDASRLHELGRRTGLETRTCSLDDEAGLLAMLRGVRVVVHAAGPFTVTSRPMGRACLAAGVHYLDITGEIPVFEKMAALDGRARERGILLMPGVGFDVVPSDCLAAHLKRRLPSATQLSLAIAKEGGGMSRGTLRTILRHLGGGSIERVDGLLVPAPLGGKRLDVDFGSGPRRVISVPWGDLGSAYHSTGVPNITTYWAYPALMARIATRLHWFRPLFRTRAAQVLLHGATGVLHPEGPDPRARASGRSLVWGEMRDDGGHSVRARFRGPEIYALTARLAVDIALRVRDGEGRPGFATPSMLFGPDYILGFDGVKREDLP